MAKYRVGLIGCGRRGDRRGGSYGIAEAHTWGYEAHPDTEIVAAADISADNLAVYCDDHNVAGRYTDYKEMLKNEGLDIVSICTWPQFHASMTIAAAEAGVKGVLCEKPMAVTLAEAERMNEVCKVNNTKLSIDHQRRLGEPFRVAKEIANSGEIGELLKLEMHVAGSNLYDWGTHWIDMMFFYLNDESAEWVMAQTDVSDEKINWALRVENHCIANIQYKSGVRGYLEIGQPIKGQMPNRLIGSEGYVELLPIAPNNPQQRTVRARTKTGEWLIPDVTEHIHARENFNRSVADLVAAIDQDKDSELNGYRGRAALEVITAAFESSLRRKRVALPLGSLDYSPLEKLIEEEAKSKLEAITA